MLAFPAAHANSEDLEAVQKLELYSASRSHKPRKLHCDDIIWKEEGGKEQRGIKVKARKKKELS